MSEDNARHIVGSFALSRHFMFQEFIELLAKMPYPSDPKDQTTYDSLRIFIEGLSWRTRDALEEVR